MRSPHPPGIQIDGANQTESLTSSSSASIASASYAASNGSSVSHSDPGLSSASQYGSKKARLLYQPDTPKSGRRRRDCLQAVLESRLSSPSTVISLLLNVVLIAVILSYTLRSEAPECMRDSRAALAFPGGVESAAQQLEQPDATPAVVAPLASVSEPQPAVSDANAVAEAQAASPPSQPSDSPPFSPDASDSPIPASHSVAWSYCLQPDALLRTLASGDGNLTLPANFPSLSCPATPAVEQSWQTGWYGVQVVVNGVTERHFPAPQHCIHLPPSDYRFPAKYLPLPATEGGYLHWPNLRVADYSDLIVFNRATPKNLYHFNAPQYDLDGLEELSLAARYIPLQAKVRNFLDIGAGGGSLGLLLKRKYDIQAMSVIFPDWPYCEYITERGGLCVLVDAMEAMPFAHRSFDAVHVSWVYHGQQPDELMAMFTEIDRIIRPGGYLWQRGGWSMRQVTAQKALMQSLGYTLLYENLQLKPADITRRISFGENLPFEAEWQCIYVKPIRAVRRADCTAAPELLPQPTK